MSAAQAGVTQTEVLQALARVEVPESRADLVSAGLVRDLRICGGNVAFRVVPPEPGSAGRPDLERAAREAVQQLPGVSLVNIRPPEIGSRSINPGDPLPEVRNLVAVASGKG